MSLLRVENLTVRFGGLTALNRVSMTVEAGRIFSVIGPNGAGKTTLFNAITGVHSPTAGSVLLHGRPIMSALSPLQCLRLVLIAALSALGLLIVLNIESLWEAVITANYQYQQPFPWRVAAASFAETLGALPRGHLAWPLVIGGVLSGCGALSVWLRSRRAPDVVAKHGLVRTFQNIRLFPEMSVVDNVLVGMHNHLRTGFWDAALRLPRFWRERERALAKAMDILAFTGLQREAGVAASSLSYGHRRRLEIARALAAEPVLLLLDEPGAGMNPSEIGSIMDLIRRIRDRGVTILLIEHHMKVVMGISDRVLVLDHGEQIAEGSPAEISSDPRVIEAYLGKKFEGEPAP